MFGSKNKSKIINFGFNLYMIKSIGAIIIIFIKGMHKKNTTNKIHSFTLVCGK